MSAQASDIINNIVWATTMDSLYKARITASFHYTEIILPPNSTLFCLASYLEDLRCSFIEK